MLFIPELTDFTIIMYLFYIIFGLVLFNSESKGKYNLPYSKFATSKGISPKIGMFIIYFLPILAYLSYINFSKDFSFYQIFILIFFIIHFGKRCLEVLLLHKFSGKIGIIGVVFITFAYTNIAVIFGSFTNSQTGFDFSKNVSSIQISIGLLLLLIGQIGNFYHHLILLNLRKASNEYFIPEKGLFKILVCPHYFFELISWLGLAIGSGFIDAFFVLFIMTCYLMGRSNITKEWYINKFPDFPKTRNRIFPFLF